VSSLVIVDISVFEMLCLKNRQTNGQSKTWRDRRDSLYRWDSRSCGRRDRL